MLREINLIGKISAVRVRVISAEVLKQMSGASVIDFDKLLQLCTLDDGADRADDSWSDVKAIVAAFEFIFFQAAKNETDGEVLSLELQQLGMPKEHSDRLVRAYTEAFPHLREALNQQRLQLPRFSNADWQVNFVLASNSLLTVNEASVHLKLSLLDGQEHAFELSADKLRAFIGELKTARDLLQNLDAE